MASYSDGFGYTGDLDDNGYTYAGFAPDFSADGTLATADGIGGYALVELDTNEHSATVIISPPTAEAGYLVVCSDPGGGYSFPQLDGYLLEIVDPFAEDNWFWRLFRNRSEVIGYQSVGDPKPFEIGLAHDGAGNVEISINGSVVQTYDDPGSPLTDTWAGFGHSATGCTYDDFGAADAGGPQPPSEGEATGSIAWVGTVTGTTVRSGSASGSVVWAGTVTGSTVRRGLAAGAVGWGGTVNGTATRTGAVSGSVGWVGAVTGARASSGSASGAISWAGAVNGDAPDVGSSSGAVTGNVGWVGVVTGVRHPVGSVAGGITWIGATAAVTTRSGAVTGEVMWAGTATGRSAPLGAPSVARYWRVRADDRVLAPIHDRTITLPANTRRTIGATA